MRTLVLATLLLACGARTNLRVGASDASVPDAFAPSDARPQRDAPFFLDAAPPCRTDLDCDDQLACTGDFCTESGCAHDANDALCDDGRYCDGMESCTLAGCRAGTPPCDDGVDCTADACIEARRE